MTTETEDDWPTPGASQHSFWNPAGPFRPLRRILTWLTILAVVVLGVGFAAGAWQLGISVLFGIPTLLTAWGVLWFIDTILAYLKK